MNWKELSNEQSEILLGRQIYESKIAPGDVHLAENALLAAPEDLRLRARLLLCYTLQDMIGEIADSRLAHVFWFVNNVPDWKFCGESFFYLSASQPGYDGLKQLWLRKISQSPNLMRRVNAYLLFAYHGDAELKKYFQEFFSGHEDSAWVKALLDIGLMNQTWFHDAVCAESEEPLPSTDAVDAPTELSKKKKWDIVAANHSETASYADFECANTEFNNNQDLDNLAILAGYSWTRYHLHSTIQFDPEMVLFRFKLAAWVLRNVAGSRLVRSPFYMAPFIDSIFFPNVLGEPIEFLTNLLIAQIQRKPEDKQIAKNAAFFRTCIDINYPAQAKKISVALRETEVGKMALRSCQRR